MNNRLFENFGSFAVITLLAVAGGLAFVHLGRSPTYQAMLILMAAGGVGLLVLTRFGIIRETLLFGLGFTLVISPVKDFTFQEGDASYMWVIQGVTFSAFDAVLLVFVTFYARNIASTLHKHLPWPVIVLIAGYVAMMLLSMTRIDPSGNTDVALTQLLYEGRCFLVFAATFTLMLNPGPSGLMTDLRCILIGLSCAAMLEAGIVCLEYIGAIQEGPLLMGIRVGSHRESLAMGETLRVGGTFQHPNYLVIFAGAAFLLLWQTQMDSHPEAKRSLLFWPGMGAAFLCMILTLSRSGWTGTFVGATAYVSVMLAGRGWPWVRTLPWKYVVPALLVVCMIGLYFSGSVMDKIFNSAAGNVTSRQYMNEMTLNVIYDNPWLGVGLGQHGFSLMGMSQFRALMIGINTIPAAHNIYLVILSEIGIFGALFYFLIPVYSILYGLTACLKNPNHKAAALACAACTAIMIYQVADVASISLRHLTLPLLYWFLLGIIIGLSRVLRNEPEPRAKPLAGGTRT